MNKKNSVMYMIIRPIEPYILDVFHICAIPSGFEARTRWKKKWLSELAGNSKPEECENVLVIIHNQENDTYYPIEWGKFKKVEIVGGIYKFDFMVTDFIKLSSIDTYSDDQIKKFSDYFKIKNSTFIGKDLPIYERKNVIIGDDYNHIDTFFSKDNQDELESWGNVTKTLSKIKELENKEFIKIVDCRTLNGKAVLIEDGKYNLESNEIYELRILQHVYDSSQPMNVTQHKLNLNSPKEHINVLKPSAVIVGKYDYVELKFKTLSFNKRENSYLAINTDNSDIYNCYTIELPTLITPVSKLRTIICLVLSIVFAIILIWGSVTHCVSSTIIELLRIALIVTVMSSSDAIKYLITMSFK